MSTQSETQAIEAPVANLAAARKEMAVAKQRHPATQAKKAAKPAPAKKAEKAEKKEGQLFVYEATGRFGVTNRRTFDRQMAVAVDVKDPSNPSPRWQGGLITRFFASREMAERYIERQTGCDCQIVDAKLVETKEA